MAVEAKPGDMFGAWRVEEYTGKNQAYLCTCTACGITQKKIRIYDLVKGKTLMCRACSRRSKAGPPKPPEYGSWSSMIQRCTNPNSKDYPNYGGRGIKVCDLWLNSFDAFFMSMGPRPTPEHTLERIDTNGNYEPGNVKWATRKEQAQNLRCNVKLEIDGEVKTVAEWSRHPDCPVNMFVIYKRLDRGWDPKRAVFEKSQKEK